MRTQFAFIKPDLGRDTVYIFNVLIISFLVLITIVIFPTMLVKSAPETHIVEGVNGYIDLTAYSEVDGDGVYKLRGTWEFYPNQLYLFQDFTSGRTGEPRMAQFPHLWKNEHEEVIGNVGYATYRMRIRVPSSFDGIGIYSRYQNSAYEIYLNDIPICQAGVVDEDFDQHEAGYLPTNGYTFATIGEEGRTFSVILRVQNEASATGGLGNDILIGSAESIKNLRTLLVMINGFISGGLLLLSICLLLIYFSSRERTEYLDYTVVSLAALFISLTNGGESLMYSIGLNSVFLARLEYCAFILGAFFANQKVLKSMIKSKAVLNAIYIYTALAMLFFLFAPLVISSKLKIPIIVISVSFFVLSFINSFREIVSRRDFSAVASFVSYIIIFTGMFCIISGWLPWDSVDVFSISIMIHCVLHMLMFLYRYRKTEQRLKEMTETLEERIIERTTQLTNMKEKAEAATVAKSNFLATMSHEIRTPMNAIMGISDLMRTDNLDDVQLSYLSDIKKSAKALLQIINDILDISKIEAGKLEINPGHFNLMATYDNICSICSFSADGKGLEFRHSFASDIPQYIIGDEVRYRQVIINIINNAIKYTKDGYVDFRVEKTQFNGSPFLAFVVEDTGIGIKRENYDKLFHSFEQLDNESTRKIEGTGLGLSISKLLVTLMKGDIQFESEYGKGSVFTIFLPLVEGSSEQVSAPSDYVPVIIKEGNVLVVDDNQINLTVATGFLEIHGLKPDTALSGAEAIEKIKNNSYDLVFMDHMMPEMDGIETTKVIRGMDGGRFSDLPIVALTANAMAGAEELFKEAGMDDFLSKPIDAGQINILLTRWIPGEKIVSGMSLQSGEEDIQDEYSDIFDGLYRIDGLQVSNGMAHVANNKSVYLSILRQFCYELDGYITSIMCAIEENDWPNYTIKLHAMKGVFANIGAAALAEWSHRLEAASRNKQYEICQRETDVLCERMEELRDKLVVVVLVDKSEPDKKTTIDEQELKQKLEELGMACMLGDIDTAEEIQKSLAGRSFSPEVDEKLNEVYALVSSFDFELVAEHIQEIMKQIQS